MEAGGRHGAMQGEGGMEATTQIRPDGQPDEAPAPELREAQATLLGRPRISIRLRMIISLAVSFFLCVILASATLQILHRVRFKVENLKSVEALSFHVQQARRFEKDFLLYGTSLDAAKENSEAALAIYEGQASRLRQSAWNGEAGQLGEHLEAYARLLQSLWEKRAVALQGDAREKSYVLEVESALRRHGSEMSGLSEQLVVRENASLDDMLRRSAAVTLGLLVLLLVLFLAVAVLLNRAMVNPILRFEAYNRRIAQGDFSPIRPARWYRDEFSDLAVVVNQMLAALKVHQDRCVKAGKLAVVGTLTSGIAHEINNPLNNISITTEALMEGFKTLGDEQKWKYLQDIYFETERAAETVKSLLDFTRKERLEMKPLNVVDVIQQTARLVNNEMAISNVVFEARVPGGLPEVLGSFNQLRQVFLNLFLNAIQAMPQGGRLLVTARMGDDGKVCVEVHDDGMGIAPELLPRVFDPFFTTKEPGKGTGLGLSVSVSILKKHGGDIRVESEKGKGTTFCVCLPSASDGSSKPEGEET